jgi:hypothetical protein
MTSNVNNAATSAAEPWFVTMPWPDDERGTFQEVVMATSKDGAINEITRRMKASHPSFSLSELREESPIDCLKVSDQIEILMEQAYGVNLKVDQWMLEQLKELAAAQEIGLVLEASAKETITIITEIGASDALQWAVMPTHIRLEVDASTLTRWWSAYSRIRSEKNGNYCVNFWWDDVDFQLLTYEGSEDCGEPSYCPSDYADFNLDESEVRLEGPQIRIDSDGDVCIRFTNKHGDGELWCDLPNIETLLKGKVAPETEQTAEVAA